MTDLVLVDSELFIHAGRGITQAGQYLDSLTKQYVVALSLITRMELIVGCRSKQDLAENNRFLARYRTIGIDGAVTDKASALLRKYRLSHGLMIPDSLIAATAICWNVPLTSKNRRHFHYINSLEFLIYPQ